MFNNLDPKNKDIDDIFADTDNAQSAAPVSPSAPRPAMSPMPSAVNSPVVNAMPSASDLGLEEASTKSKMGQVLKKLFIFIAILALVGAAAYFIYAKFLVNSSSEPVDTTIPVENIPVVPIVETSVNPVVTTTTISTSTLATSTALDADNDGLSDTEETILSTDPMNMDTDGDGLSDGDEVKKYSTDPLLKDSDSDGLVDGDEVNIYKTDPKNVDTDGDTYKDGDEIKGGYDPLKSGAKLLTTPVK
ncbi:MAG: hypothetical protein WCJ57_02120 [Candidatus Falkowbacteria bacterium]